MNPGKVTVWWGIAGPNLFKDPLNRNVTVNDVRYRGMISKFFFAKNTRA